MAVIPLSKRNKTGWYGIFFFINGIVTSFLDFMTTETLSLLLPLLLLLWIERKQQRTIKTALESTVTWSTGFSVTWVLKWILAGIVFHENVLPYVGGHIREKVGGVPGLNLLQSLWAALSRNISCMFPAGYGIIGVTATVALAAADIVFCIIYHRRAFDRKLVLVFSVLGLLPVVRYLVLHHHSSRTRNDICHPQRTDGSRRCVLCSAQRYH